MDDVLDIPWFLRAAARCKSCYGQGCEPHETDDGRLIRGPACERCGGSGIDPTARDRGTEHG